LLTLGPRAHSLLREQLGLSHQEIKRLRHSFVPMFADPTSRDSRFLGVMVRPELVP